MEFAEVNQEIWRQRYGNLQKYLNPNPLQRYLIRRFHTKIDNLIKEVKVSRVLDAGCGEGFVIRDLQERNRGVTFEGIDFAPSAIALAKRLHPHTTFHIGDIRHLPFSAGAFDLILCLEVLEHLPDPDQALVELRRVTSRFILASVPHEPFFRLANLLRGKHIGAWGNDPEHLQNWTAAQFLHLMGRHLTVEKLTYSFPWVIALCHKEV
ncbi:MAG: class I SAM-dependent methyltransferase [Anaerolineae bacterium]